MENGDGSSDRGQPPFPAPPQTWWMAAGSNLLANGPTPPLPLGRQLPLLDPGVQQRTFHPTCSSIAPAPLAASGGLRFFLLPDLFSTAIPLSSEGSSYFVFIYIYISGVKISELTHAIYFLHLMCKKYLGAGLGLGLATALKTAVSLQRQV